MKNNRVLILTGGHCSYDFVSEYLLEESFDTVIVVDRGLMVADKLDIQFDYLMGDFDSVSKDTLEKFRMDKELKHIEVKEYKPEKDATDTELAIELAIEMKASEIIILGGTGTRLDHVLANIHLLKKPLEHNVKTYILDDHNKIYLSKESISLQKKEQFGDYVSLLPYTEVVEEVNLEGFKYPLYNHRMTIGESLGVSNELISEHCKISFTKGTLIIIESRD